MGIYIVAVDRTLLVAQSKEPHPRLFFYHRVGCCLVPTQRVSITKLIVAGRADV
jgi:hypothetical protein